MNDHQKALFTQLQIAGLGLVLTVMGFLRKDRLAAFIPVGLVIFAFGLIRFVTIFILTKEGTEDMADLEQTRQMTYQPKSFLEMIETDSEETEVPVSKNAGNVDGSDDSVNQN